MMIPILLGSDSDKPFAEKITKALDPFAVPYEVVVTSAHKVPEKCVEIVNKYNQEDGVCFVTIAGRSNGLSGVIAGSSIHPVIACPPLKDKEDYLINIHSTLQMPSDTPVLTAIDPQNAAMAALRILAASNKELREKVEAHIQAVKAKFE